MKKYLFLFLLPGLLTLNACSNDDDDNGEDNSDPIVGTWTIVQIQPAMINIDGCEDSSTITFNESGSASGIYYTEETECNATPASGTWTNQGSNNYSITGIPVINNLSGTVDFETENRFVFTSSTVTITFQRLTE